MYRCSCNRDRGIRIFIIALIVICALGYLVYSGYIKHDHTSDGDWEIVNNATCTDTGLRVKYCKICGKEAESEIIPISHVPAEPVEEKRVEPTHASKGSYNTVTYCLECDAVISSVTTSIPAVGHDYDWELGYDNAKGKFYADGTCLCDESGNTVIVYEGDKTNKLVVDFTNENGCACCETEFTATVTVAGKTESCSVELAAPLEDHKVAIIDAEGNHGTAFISDYAKYDELRGLYFVITDGVAITHYTNSLDPIKNEWDSNGFALGFYQCTTCGKYYHIRIYSAEHDTRLQ